MGIRINKLAGLGASLTLFAASGALSDAPGESISTHADSRWIPSFSFSSGATIQYMKADVESHCELGRPQETFLLGGVGTPVNRLACRDPEGILVPPAFPIFSEYERVDALDPLCPGTPSPDGKRACLRPNSEATDAAVSPFVGASIQLMTPRMRLLPGRPRAFVSGELLTFWAQQRHIAQEGSPGTLGFPEALNQPIPKAHETSGPTLTGTGSRVSSEVQRLGWGARAGLAFPFVFLERRLWLKPAFGWMRYEVDIEALVVAAIKDDPIVNPASPGDPDLPPFGRGIREINFTAEASETYDAIGPGLELEMEVGRFGPLGVSLFLDAHAYWVLGERVVDFSAGKFCPSSRILGTGGCATALLQSPNSGVELIPIPEPYEDSDPRSNQSGIGADTYSGEFSHEVAPVNYRAGVGIRFHWLGR